MTTLRIHGGKPLAGQVAIGGAKNAASKLILASLLTSEPCSLTNVPQIGETEIALELVRATGATATQQLDVVTIDASTLNQSTVSELSRKNRLPILAIAPLLHRTGSAHVPRLGGDKIGARPVDFHVTALEAFGATIQTEADAFVATADRLHGAKVTLPFPSVGATETVLFAAVLADGETVLENAAIEPEIIDLIDFLKAMGADITQTGERSFTIVGVDSLHGAEHKVIPDRLEAASYLAAAVATNGDVTVTGVDPEHLAPFLTVLSAIGCQVEVGTNTVRATRGSSLVGTSVRTDVYPGFATDWQQPLCVVLTQATGESVIHETVYEDRVGYTSDLRRMGASIRTTTDCYQEPCRLHDKGAYHTAFITGPTELHGANVTIPDIRAGMAHVIGALTATGESVLSQVDILDRGYQQLEEKLTALGADITRTDEPTGTEA